MDVSLPSEDPVFESLLLDALPRVRRNLGQHALDAHELEDVLQDALAKALAYRASFDPARGNLTAWLSRVAQRVLLERRARREKSPDRLTFDPSGPTEKEREDAVTREELLRALAFLGTKERQVLLGFHAQEKSIQELSLSLKMPEGTIKSHLHRARKRLAAELGRRGFGEDSDLES